ncbi:ribonuclease T2 [Sistotremastrum suecicum HHB10207 ss-3]|uniref:Ribonuclease T2-like n=1 Tax=Sistotremastrum suecicum HHB10207 ss-3 TaxID=1314776 RepID=A0A166IL74_9AGAM|nr:ribonuclease T2 [Sistotremastrum suecicum HHB10207 ss-3]
MSLLALATLLLSAALPSIASPYWTELSPANRDLFKRGSSTCGTGGVLSCTNTTAQNTCCFESPGGHLLQVQFWDTNPSTGPTNSWTIHGLWPDHCDETFDQFCDESRQYTDISGVRFFPSDFYRSYPLQILTAAGATDTLNFMNEFWKDQGGDDETFWEHEWGKHGTCMSTLVPSCLPKGSAAKAEAVDFFNTVVRLFQGLPTFTFLSSQGITPSSTATFTLSQLTSALKKASGFTPGLDCTSGVLNQITWYHELRGSVIDGTFVQIDAPQAGSCPSTGIKYPPKTGTTSTPPSGPSSTTTTGSSPTGPPGSLPTKSTLSIFQSGSSSKTGGLLTAGTWSTQTPATYTISGSTSSLTLSTSKGKCQVSGGSLTCGSSVTTASTFSAVTSGSQLLIAFGGSTSFSSDGVPSGTVQETVFTGTGHSKAFSIIVDAA